MNLNSSDRVMHLDQFSIALHETAKSKGFYDSLDLTEFNSQAKQLAMVHSEVSEVLEALRKDKGQDKVVEELADILIRVFDLYAALKEAGVVTDSLQDSLITKAGVNQTREKMHGVRG